MKLLMTVQSLFPKEIGGVERHNNSLIRHLTAESEGNLEIDLIHPYTDEIFEELDSVNEHLLGPKFEGPVGRIVYSRKVAKKIDSLKKEKEFDLIYGVRSSILYPLISHYPLPAPLIYHNHGYHQLQEGDYTILRGFELADTRMRKIIKTHGTRFIAKRSDYIASLGGRLTDLLCRKLKVPKKRIVQIPNAIDLDYIKSFGEETEKIPNSLLFVGSIVPRKGLWQLLESLEEINFKSSIKAYIIGSGNLIEDPKFKTKLGKLDRKVCYLGRVSEEELYKWYSRTEAFVFPTLVDGMPTVILEAMARGLPIISTDVGAIPNLVKNKENGYVIPPSSSKLLSKAIKRFFNQPESKKERMRDKSQERAKVFSWGKTGRRILKIFESAGKISIDQ